MLGALEYFLYPFLIILCAIRVACFLFMKFSTLIAINWFFANLSIAIPVNLFVLRITIFLFAS